MYRVKRWTRESEKAAVFENWTYNPWGLMLPVFALMTVGTHACWCFLQREWETYPQNNPGIQDLLNISQVAEEQKTCSIAYRPQLGVQVA